LIHGKDAGAGVVTGYCLDSGCVGRNVTGKNILKMIPDAQVEHLDPPIMLQNPWNGTAPCSLQATVTVVLETKLGPCVFTGVKFLVCDLPIKSLYFGTSFQALLGLPVLEDELAQRYAGTTTALDSGTPVTVEGVGGTAATPAVVSDGDPGARGPAITVVDVGGMDAGEPTTMAASEFGWSMADAGDDGVDQVPGEQAAFDDILPEPGQDDEGAVHAENVKLLEDKLKKALINGLPPALADKLRSVIDIDNCRERLGADGGMRVKPVAAEVFPDGWLKLAEGSYKPLRCPSTLR
jgi:hypothetical protein